MNAQRQTHAKPEFYAHGVGWVPVEATEKFLKNINDPPLSLFGFDHATPTMIKCVDNMDVDLPQVHFGRKMSFKGQISLYQVWNLGARDTNHSLVHWKVMEI